MWGNNITVTDKFEKKVTVTDIPKLFQELDLHPVLASNISTLNFAQMTEIQGFLTKLFPEKQDIIAKSMTGSGKTLAFLVPIIDAMLKEKAIRFKPDFKSFPVALIIVPTRELGDQVQTECLKLLKDTFIQTEMVVGGKKTVFNEKRLRYGVDIVVATPGRLLHMIREGNISLEMMQFLVIDEADVMFDMGFKKDIEFILEHETYQKGKVKTIYTSATFDEDIMALIQGNSDTYMKITPEESKMIGDNIQQDFVVADKEEKFEKLQEIIKESTGQILVFTDFKKEAEWIAKMLNKNGIEAAEYHGNLGAYSRTVAL